MDGNPRAAEGTGVGGAADGALAGQAARPVAVAASMPLSTQAALQFSW